MRAVRTSEQDTTRDATLPRSQGSAVTGRPFAYAIVGGMVVVDLISCARIGLFVDAWATAAGVTCALLLFAAVYRGRSRPMADMAEGAALWIGFTGAACVLTYVFATCGRPLQDAALNAMDARLGFDWPAWRARAGAWPPLGEALRLAYFSLLPQIVVSVLYFPAVGLSGRTIELVILAAVTLLPTTLIATLWPALGPFSLYGGHGSWWADLLVLRQAGPWHFELTRLEGIISMPSYHAVLCALFVHAFRRTGAVGWAIAGINGLMMLSIAPVGGHYLVDILAGIAIALLAAAWWRRVARGPDIRLRNGT